MHGYESFMKVCLDTNFIWGWFENAIKAYRRNLEEYETGKFDPTKKMEFLVRAKHELVTTNVAKTEVFRKLFSEKTVGKELCFKVWSDFLRIFSITLLEVNLVDFNEIAELCLITQLGKGSIPNLIQIQFAKNRNLPFATDTAIKDHYTYYNEKIQTYIDLRKIYDAEKLGQ